MKLHNDITRLPLSIFIDCLVDNNLQSLLREGEATPEDLETAWLQIQEQYAEAMGNMEHRLFLKLLQEVNGLSYTLKMIEVLVEVMFHYYHPDFASQLNKCLKTNFHFDPKRRGEYEGLLKRCETRKLGIEMQLEIKQEALNELALKMEKGGNQTPTRVYFQRMLNIMEEHFPGTSCDDNMTVFRFCDRINRMVEKVRNEQIKRHGRGKR